MAAATTQPVRQRVRGTSFKQEYQGPAGAARKTGRARAPSMTHDTSSKYCLPEQDLEDKGKITLVLDLDETLVYAREGPLYARPGLDEFFKACSEKCEIVVWTAGLRAYAQAIIRNIDKENVVKHCIYRHSKWFTGQAGYRKDLAALGRSLDRTLIIENTPDCFRGYQQNAVLVDDYAGGERTDNTIPALTDLISQLNASQMTVPEFITRCPLLTKGPVQTDLGDYIQVYSLNVRLWNPETYTRVNRDLAK